MFHRASDAAISTDDWTKLNTAEVPTNALIAMYAADDDAGAELVRLGVIPEPDGRPAAHGPVSDRRSFPAAHGTCWLVEHLTGVRRAATGSGFIAYEADGGPLCGALVLWIDDTGDHAGPSRWIMLRARIARRACRVTGDRVAWLTIRAALLDECASDEGVPGRFAAIFADDLESELPAL